MLKNLKVFIIVLFGILGVGAVSYFLVGSQTTVAAGNDAATLAMVNGTEITRADVKAVAASMPAAAQVPIEQLYPLIVDQLVNDTLLAQRVDSLALENDPVVQERLDEAKGQIIRNLYIERFTEESVTDAKIKEAYETLKAENKDQKEVRARHILLETEEAANGIIEKLKGGADFATLAIEHSTGPTGAKGGDLGYFGKTDMVAEFAEEAFSLKKGTYSQSPVKTQFGWHVVFVEDSRDRKVPKLDEVKDLISNQLKQEAVAGLVENMRVGAEIKTYTWDGDLIEK